MDLAFFEQLAFFLLELRLFPLVIVPVGELRFEVELGGLELDVVDVFLERLFERDCRTPCFLPPQDAPEPAPLIF